MFGLPPIDVKSEQRYANLEDPGYQSLLAINGIEEALADQLFSRKILSTAVLAEAAIEDLTVLRAIGEEQAVYLIQAARKSLGQDPDAPIERKKIVSEPLTEEQPLQDTLAEDLAAEETTVEEDQAVDVSEDPVVKEHDEPGSQE